MVSQRELQLALGLRMYPWATSRLVGGLAHVLWLSIYWECHHPNWLIFFKRVEATNQKSIWANWQGVCLKLGYSAVDGHGMAWRENDETSRGPTTTTYNPQIWRHTQMSSGQIPWFFSYRKLYYLLNWDSFESMINGHFRNLNWRYLPYIRLI